MANMTISPEQFAWMCYLVLMQNGDGILDKHPSYIEEKKEILTRGYDAFAALDIYNKTILVQWSKGWNVELPTDVLDYYQEEVNAAAELAAKGIVL